MASIFWTTFTIAFFKSLLLGIVGILIAAYRVIRQRHRDRSGQSETAIRKAELLNLRREGARKLRSARKQMLEARATRAREGRGKGSPKCESGHQAGAATLKRLPFFSSGSSSPTTQD